MGYVPVPPPPRLNIDRHGLPRDYFTYCWLVYGKRVEDNSPERLAFLSHPEPDSGIKPPEPDLALIDVSYA